MKKVMIIFMVMMLLSITSIASVSAEVLYDEEIEEYQFTGVSYSSTHKESAYGRSFDNIIFNTIESVSDLSYIAVSCPPGGYGRLPSGIHHQEYWFSDDSNNKKPMTIYVSETKNALGIVTSVRYTLFFDEWNIGTRTGAKRISFNAIESSNNVDKDWATIQQKFAYIDGDGTYPIYTFTITCGKYTKNHITISDEDYGNTLKIKLNRVIGGTPFASSLKVFNSEDAVIYQDLSTNDLTEYFLKSDVATIELQTVYNHTYTIPLAGDQPDTPDSVTIYVRNSQTGALISGAHILIEGTPTTSDWIEYVNETLLSGTAQYNLPGMPYQYRIVTTADGYYPAASQYFRAGKTVIVDMEPYLTAPVNESNTYLEFYTRDTSANPIGGVIVAVDDQWLYTNNNGYARFEVAKNASYPYNVTKTGYLTIEGIARVESDDRYVVNVALMRGTVPTQPTVSPTITVEPTPTQTTPPIQEDNIIGLSVKGLAKGFGIDYDTALLMFGLMIIFGAGGMVMRTVEGGAMEFIAGSIVGTYVAFALGLIPIWIFIIIAVVFGAYVLRVFVQGSQ